MPVGRRFVSVLVGASMLALAGCGGGETAGAGQTLTWYINPDNGGQEKIAARCSEQSGGAYTLDTSLLPEDASLQREQLIRRLAGNDASIDLMSLDPPFVAEFADGRLPGPGHPGRGGAALTDGVRQGRAWRAATWKGQLVAAPFWANTQLLWYRKSVAEAPAWT